MNVADSELIAGILEKENFVYVDNVEEADIVLLNTCSIREKAENTLRSKISDLKRYKNMKVIRIIYICLLFGYIFSQTTPSDTISLTFKPSGDGDAVVEILQKGKSIDADATDYMITFNCKDFGDGEEMYFKIRAKEDAFYYDSRYNGVYYQYIDSNVGYDENKLEFVSYQFKTDPEILPSGNYKIKYFTITKKKSQFRGTNG